MCVICELRNKVEEKVDDLNIAPPHHTELATKVENKSKRNQVITHNIHPQERQLPRNTHQSNSPTAGRIRKVLRTTLRSQTELESAH